MVNGSEVPQLLKPKGGLPPLSCPFCNGEAHEIHLDPPDGSSRLFAMQCKACGVAGVPARAQAEAVDHWNRRAAAAPATLATDETPADTCQVAAQLVEIARGLYSSQLPPASSAVLLLVIPAGVTPAIAMNLSNIEAGAAAVICSTAGRLLKQQAVPTVSPGGIVLPQR